MKIDRRQVLRKSLIGCGIALTPVSLRGTVRTPKVARLKPKNLHVSMAAYSVRQSLTSGKMDLFDFIDWCAELDLAGTELTSYYFEESFDAAYLRRLRNRAFRSGVTISGTAIRNNFCLPPGPGKDREIAQVKKWIDRAAELFAPHVRIFAGSVPAGTDKKTAITWTADGVKAVLDHAALRGVVLGLENHGGITARAADLLAICSEVGEHPWFGINLDTGNFEINPYEEVAMIAPLAVNAQVKVEIWNGDGNKEAADQKRLREIIVKSGYRGWVALEYEAKQDPFKAIPGYIKQLKQLYES